MLKLSFLNVFFSIFLLPLMMQCEDGRGGPCDTYTRYATQDNLCELLPVKINYDQGETVTFRFEIKSKFLLNGKQIDIFEETKLGSGLFLINLTELFKDNTVTFVKGEKLDDNRFKAAYNSATDSYELEMKIKLNRVGVYSFESTGTFKDRDYNDVDCAYITVATNIKDNNLDDGRTEFSVD